MRLRLEVGASVSEVTVGDGKHLVGRWDDCGVRVPDDTVSRHHARLRVTGQGADIEDLGSAGGLFLNGEPVRRAALRVGDVVTMGRATLEVVSFESPSNR